MRLILEIVIIGILTIFLIIFVSDRKQLDERIEQSEERVEHYKGKVDSLSRSVSKKKAERDSLQECNEYFKEQVVEKEREIIDAEKRYNDSIEAIQSTKLSDLIDSTQKIIKVNDTTYILVTEAFFRKVKEQQFQLKKAKAKVVTLEETLSLKDSIIEIKDETILNLVSQVNDYRQTIHLKDTIILEKDMQIDMLEKQNKKFKLQRNITIGAAAGIILLILL